MVFSPTPRARPPVASCSIETSETRLAPSTDPSVLLELSPDAIIGFDADLRVAFANAAAEAALGMTRVALAGCTPDELARIGVIDHGLADHLIAPAATPSTSTPSDGSASTHHIGRSAQRWFEVRVVAVDDHPVLKLALFGRDITSRIETEAALRGRAECDPLTGLLNHAAFHDRVIGALAARRDQPGAVALILVDLDYLKLLNDVHGHHVGDQALTTVAEVIRTVTRTCDVVGRLGGDEFGCLIVDTDRAATVRIAERLVATICAHTIAGFGRLSASAGVAFVASTFEPGDMFDRVDRALYDAKASGRGVVAVASDTDIAYGSNRVGRPGHTAVAPPDLTATGTRASAARAALREWVHVLGASGGCVDLLDVAGQAVKACTYYRFGHDDWTLAEQTYELTDYPNTLRAIERRETYTCRIDDADADPGEVALLRERGFASLLLTPLVAGDEPLGIVELFDTRHRTFTTDDQRMALSLASHLSALLVRLPHPEA